MQRHSCAYIAQRGGEGEGDEVGEEERRRENRRGAMVSTCLCLMMAIAKQPTVLRNISCCWLEAGARGRVGRGLWHVSSMQHM